MQSALIRKCSTHIILLGSFVVIGLSLGTGSAFAQEGEVEEIIVTGSRIARDPNLTGALPIQSIGAQEIQQSGEFSIADVVNDIPALLMSVTSEQSIDAPAAFDDGANVLNLRALGSERTLVLVNGRRHVGGLQGTSAVDVGSIPMRLIERVEVLTGGASAIYGADAVTGVVNFIMMDNFEGLSVDASYGISSDGDGAQTAITATWGTNFAGDRGNFVVSVDYRIDDGIKAHERPGQIRLVDGFRNAFGTGDDWVNPDLRFQLGEIGASTPLFEQFFNFNNTGLIHYGLAIPTAADFVADYNLEFGAAITEADLSAAELALISRGETSPQRAVFPLRTFPFTSGYGYVVAGNAATFAGFDPVPLGPGGTPIDVDGNGIPDCQESFHGWNSTFSPGAFGALGGCWSIAEDGTYSPVTDGLVGATFQGFGGDSADIYWGPLFDILLPDDKISVNLLGHYDISDSATLFGEAKYVKSETSSYGSANSFWDLLPGFPDNPFIPAFLQPIAASAGAIGITIDPLVFDTYNFTDRETVRGVVGIEGEFANGWGYEISANYGRSELNVVNTNSMINDRFYAALDAVTDPATGQPACRVDVDPLAPAVDNPFSIPTYDPGYYSFTPGAGQCVPLDIWNGRPGVTQAAADFVTRDQWNTVVIDQFVLSAFITGDSSAWFELPAGAIDFAFGAEYRDESSKATWDPWQRGIIPAGSILPAGSNINDVSDNTNLMFRPQLPNRNETGSYDVIDVFVEAAIPLLTDQTFARQLTIDFAARFSDYSSIGQTTTWKTNLIWVPVESLAFRATYSEAVRAPNVTELFGPQVGQNFRPIDPCDVAQITALRDDGLTELANNTEANCTAGLAAIGLDALNYNPTATPGTYSFFDPLSASFGGTRGGNRDLKEESAETLTVGLVFQPEFLQGLSFTADYWNISIDDAIEAVTAQNIVDGCYQGAMLNTAFCELFDRNTDPGSPQYGGFLLLRQTTLNFAKVETDGIDFAVKYQFEIGAHGFDATIQGTKVNEINFFQNPLDLTEINPELQEVLRPELAGNIFLNWSIGDLQVGWQSQYLDQMLYGGGLEIETALTLYGPIVLRDEFWIHDINARYQFNDDVLIYGGIKNLSDENPFITNNAYPASPRGTFFFVGVNWQIQ